MTYNVFGVTLSLTQSISLSTYGLKAHVREMSTPPMLTIGHGCLFYFYCPKQWDETIHVMTLAFCP